MIAWSPDGKNWTPADGAQFTGVDYDSFRNLVRAGGKFFTSNSTGSVVYESADGKNWTSSTVFTSTNPRDLFYVNGNLIACDKVYLMAWSADEGSSWAAEQVLTPVLPDRTTTPSPLATIRHIAWNGERYVIVGMQTLAWSTSGAANSWTPGGIRSTGSVGLGILFSGKGVFVLHTREGLHWSTDAETWNAIPNLDNIETGVADVVFDGTKFVGVGSSGSLIWSSDGKIWDDLDSDFERGVNVSHIAYDEDHKVFVAASTGNPATSSSGTTARLYTSAE
jgi:hypothetical protein